MFCGRACQNGGDTVLESYPWNSGLIQYPIKYFAQKNVAEESSQVPQSSLSQKRMRYVNLLNIVCGLPLSISEEGEVQSKGFKTGDVAHLDRTEDRMVHRIEKRVEKIAKLENRRGVRKIKAVNSRITWDRTWVLMLYLMLLSS